MKPSSDEMEKLFATYLRHAVATARDPSKGMHDFWAWERMMTLVDESPGEAWPLLIRLIRESPSERVLFGIAAGPLEDFIRKHGEAYSEAIRVVASGNPRFRLALSGVWVKSVPQGLEGLLPSQQDRQGPRRKLKKQSRDRGSSRAGGEGGKRGRTSR